MIETVLGDCLEVMKKYPDGYFDLVLTDPPYGIGINKSGNVGGANSKSKNANLTDFTPTVWDDHIPEKKYFDEIMRISKNQIIFGGNYFVEYLSNSSCWLVWDKVNDGTPFADCELAWTSFKSAVRIKRYMWNGMLQQDMKNKERRLHPTQKPTAVMRWCIANYSKEGDKILDPFMGSGTTLRAAMDLHRHAVGIEINPEYVKIAEDRLKQGVLI